MKRITYIAFNISTKKVKVMAMAIPIVPKSVRGVVGNISKLYFYIYY